MQQGSRIAAAAAGWPYGVVHDTAAVAAGNVAAVVAATLDLDPVLTAGVAGSVHCCTVLA